MTLCSTVVGAEDPVVDWPDVRQVGYESELAVAVGAVARNVSAEEALDDVAGTPSLTTRAPETGRRASGAVDAALSWAGTSPPSAPWGRGL